MGVTSVLMSSSASTRESQTHDVDVCGARKAYNMVAKRVINNQFRDAKLNKRSRMVRRVCALIVEALIILLFVIVILFLG